MAIRYAVANGNWSNTATWDGGTLPAIDDDVFANNFTVIIDGTFTVLSIKNTAGTGIVAGGKFILDGDLTVALIQASVSGVLEITKNTGEVFLRGFYSLQMAWSAAISVGVIHSGTATFNVIATTINNNNPGYATNQTFFTKTSSGILNIISDLNWPTGSNNSQLFSISNGNTFFVGNILNLSNSTRGPVINQSGGNLTFVGDIMGGLNFSAIGFSGGGNLNITGNISGSLGTSIATSTIYVTSNCNVLITGNLSAGVFATAGSLGLVSNPNVIIVGNVSGGGASTSIVNTTSPALIDVTGIITSGVSAPAISGLITTFVIVRGNVINTDTYNAIHAGRIAIDDNVTSWNYKDSTNTINRTLYSAGVALGNPLEEDVRDGVDYGASLEFTGSLAVPSSDNVRKGVAIDNTIGTADLTAEDFLDAIATSTNDIAIRLRNVSTVQTTGDQIANL